MPGRNLFEEYRLYKTAASTSLVCVFISHKSEDKPMARLVAQALMDMGADIYFDENDAVLRAASASGDDAAIVQCIEDGLSRSTHLLGLITKRTFKSWWVPFEIGGARGRSKQCGHLVSSDVDELPSYVKVEKLILDIHDLSNWLSKPMAKNASLIVESLIQSSSGQLPKYLPRVRLENTIKFF